MKKYGIVAFVILVVLSIALAQDTQPQPQNRFQNMTAEQRQAMRDRFQNMSEEERAQFRPQMGQRGGFGGRMMNQERQLEAIKTIEEQTAKLKAAIKGYERPDFAAMRDMSQEDRAALMQKMRTAAEEQQKILAAIQAQVIALQGRSAPSQITREDVQELRAIQVLAVEEKAEKTAERLQKLADKIQPMRRGRTRGQGQTGDAPARRAPREGQ